MTQLMEATSPKRRLKRTSAWAFLDATFAWAMSPRLSAARVWQEEEGERLEETRGAGRGIRSAGRVGCKPGRRWPCLMGVNEGNDAGQQAAEDGHQHRLHQVVLGRALRWPRAQLPVVL